jgi:ABC-type lipoprotein export system ATPase subunit
MTDASQSKRGSLWRRWDLHLHAPGTKLANSFGNPDGATLKAYVEKLEASDVYVFGIADYFSFDSYFAVRNAYQAAYPESKKLIIPNIEFRLTETISKDARHVHTHVLIDPKAAIESKLSTLLIDLPTHITRNGSRVRCHELSSKADYEQATVSMADLCNALSANFPDPTAYMIVTAANNDGLKGVDTKSLRSLSISDELDKSSNAFFGSSKNVEYFLKTDRYEDGTPSDCKPVFSGSDAHSFDDLDRLTGDESGYVATWIKADLTFRGLRQTLFEPKGRVHIGERPTVLQRQDQDATRFISELRINQVAGYSGSNGSWFKDVVIPFNPELTAIIGNKGSGKSAVADILGLLGESRQFEYFSFLTDKTQNRKFRQKGYAENYAGKLTWASNAEHEKRLDQLVDLNKPEAVKYLPQNYFESLTNEIEVKAFRVEIEEVVFSHVEESDRLGQSSFAELEDLTTVQSKNDISSLKVRLRELNIEIVDLEKQADPATKAALSEQLKQKQEEYRVLEASKPSLVVKPTDESAEQKGLADQIEKIRQDLAGLELRIKEALDSLSSSKSDLVSLSSITEAVMALDSKIELTKQEQRTACERHDLDIDAIVSHRIDTSTIDLKTRDIGATIKSLEADSEVDVTDAIELSSLVSLPDLRRGRQFLSDKLNPLQETLSAPQRRYQRYVQAMSDLDTKMAVIMGDGENSKPGTIRDIEHRIRYIDEELTTKLAAKYANRAKIAHSIFEAKMKVRGFYEALKSRVEERLATVRSEGFEVTIDASFISSHQFPEQFFNLVNQASSGPFRGTVQGATELESRMTETNWNDIDSVLEFANRLIDSIRTEDVSKQVKDVKALYDLLFSFEYFDARYELRLGGKNLNQLSPGEKGLLLLVFYLHLDKEKTPLIIDQPEDNLDNDSIFSVLAKCIRQAKKTRQVILVTHNPNLAVGADAEQILYVSLDKAGNYKFSYEAGAIENSRINDVIVKILEGSKPAFVQRRLAYQIS